MNTLEYLLVLETEEKFQERHPVNDCDVALNRDILYEYRLPKAKAMPTVRVEGAETTKGNWCWVTSVSINTSGYGGPISLCQIKMKFDIENSKEKATIAGLKHVLWWLKKNTEQTADAKKVISILTKELSKYGTSN